MHDSNNIQVYSDKLKELDEIVRTMVLESLNLEKYMDEHMKLTNYLVRVMKYRKPLKDESNMGLLSHADKNILTILQSNDVEGLEVQHKDNGEWFKVKFSPNSCVVMVGEAFKVSSLKVNLFQFIQKHHNITSSHIFYNFSF